jgi:formylglycine-generating enzyme required for sulfatase activity
MIMNKHSADSGRLRQLLGSAAAGVTIAAFVAASATLAQAQAPALEGYEETIPGTSVKFQMVPIPGGSFKMGSPATEADRKDDEGPQITVEVEPFWMGAREVTWDEFDVFGAVYTELANQGAVEIPADKEADAVSFPTPQYESGIEKLIEMGRGGGFPAVDMTYLCAMQYTKWLSKKTGKFYRLPTEAEWEYAARAGTTTAYSFGDDPAGLEETAWFIDNSGEKYHKVGQKKPNPWGLYDIHGNVSEWVLDQYDAGWYKQFEGKTVKAADIVNWPKTEYPIVVRGGGYASFPDEVRSASRAHSKEEWNKQDPQVPMSIWWHTEPFWNGLRIVRPAVEPSAADKAKYWEPIALERYMRLMKVVGDKQKRSLIQ